MNAHWLIPADLIAAVKATSFEMFAGVTAAVSCASADSLLLLLVLRGKGCS